MINFKDRFYVNNLWKNKKTKTKYCQFDHLHRANGQNQIGIFVFAVDPLGVFVAQKNTIPIQQKETQKLRKHNKDTYFSLEIFLRVK